MRILWSGLVLVLLGPGLRTEAAAPLPEVKRFEVPYRLTIPKHVLVRAKINGKGPYNFILDTGAPALIVSTKVCEKLGVKPDNKGWGTFDRFEIEGGVVVPKAPVRIETPFQLEGMNGLGLAGTELHGLIGYNILARYRMKIDFTQDKMTWTELDFMPAPPKGIGKGGGQGGLEVIGSIMKFAGALLGTKPNYDVTYRIFLGVTLAEENEAVIVKSVLADGPAGKSGLKPGDKVIKFNGRRHLRNRRLPALQQERLSRRHGQTDDRARRQENGNSLQSGGGPVTMKRFLFAPLFVALVAFSPVSADEVIKVKPVVVPFELLPTGHMTVKVKVNGKGPYRLIFDTGAPITLLNTKVAKESGVDKDAAKSPFPIFAMKEAKVAELQVGDQKAKDLSAVVMDHPTVEAISKAFSKEFGPIEGIVGFPFFARFSMTLDYQAKTMTFVPNGFKPPNVMNAMMNALLLPGNPEPKQLAPAALWGLRAKEAGDEEPGVLVQSVFAKSPAAEAGLKPGDRLLTIDGRWTDSLRDLYTAASHVKAGSTVPVTVKRDGKELTLKVKPTAGL